MMWACILPVLALGAADPAAPLAAPAPPAPIFWKQTLFSIPFQVPQANTPAQQAAQVQLFVSPDRGVRWDNWRQAAPDKGYFLFRAGVDGEYWFDVRTVDRSGQVRPQGPHSPKLVVVIDTVAPNVQQFAARRGDDGRVVASFRIEEPYLKSDSLTIEYRAAATAPWQAAAIGPNSVRHSASIHTGEVAWYPPSGASAVEIRLRVSDLAGNVGEGHAQVNLSTSAATASNNPTGAGGDVARWSANPADGTSSQNSAARMPWPAENASPAGPPISPGMRVNDAQGAAASNGSVDIRVNQPANRLVSIREPAAPATASPERGFSAFQSAPRAGANLPPVTTPPTTVPQTNVPPTNLANPFNGFTAGTSAGPAAAAAESAGPPPGAKLRWINSRVFQLTYDTKPQGGGSNVPVQLWGTRDGGKTWQSYGTDPNGQSPMLVTVPEEGVYGFQMVVQDGNSAGRPPLPGEVPKTWVGIDLTAPIGRITQARQGIGRENDRLFLNWEAADNRALAEKPITLYYSERAGGPWILIASELPNSGRYTWQLSNKLPQHVYLRLEIRDAAGNTALFELPDPVALDLSAPSVSIELHPMAWTDSQTSGRMYLR
jgi:hypothetical protein